MVANIHCLLSEVRIGAGAPELIRKPFLPPASLGCAHVLCSYYPVVTIASAAEAAPDVYEPLSGARC